ncbi:MAG: MFS transporter [Deltaproteobacteria bacterium]|nr:MFS transporter [Deltaproteobacteria bacterium]
MDDNGKDGMEQEEQTDQSLEKIIRDAFRELGQTLVAFFKAPKALWGINVPYVIEGLVYFGILTILGKFCSENVGLTDEQAGWVYSGVTGGITLAMLFLGGVSDKIGVRKALVLSFVMFLLGRGLIAFSGTMDFGQGILSPMFFIMASGLLIMVLAYGLFQPAAYAGVKRYTGPKTAAMGYAVIYGLMNLGAFFSGFISPFVRHRAVSIFPPNGLAAVFWVYTGFVAVALLITVTILTRKTDKAAVARVEEEKQESGGEEGEKQEDEIQDDGKTEPANKIHVDNRLLYLLVLLAVGALAAGIAISNGRLSGNPWMKYLAYVLATVLSLGAAADYIYRRPEHPFRDSRFTFFIFVLIPVQTLFAHNWLTLPYYLDRAFHGQVVGDYFEFFSNLNPILIFVLAPLVAGLTAKANVYKMMIYGTFVMALPTLLLAVGPNVYLFLTYVLFMSIGEAMWQPRFLQWIAEIAPKGKTGVYMGIGQFPWFLTKMITGMYSGYFVATYLPKPETGEATRSGTLWLIYALIALISPIALVFAKGWMNRGMQTRAVK